MSYAAGTLSDFIRIKSEIMGYEIQYQVYTPENYSGDATYPTIYVADGPGYIEQGRMIRVMDRLIADGRMKPVIAVFVDQRDPDNLSVNRRNQELLCNADYASFYTDELIKAIEADYAVSESGNDRVMQGVSFGGFHAACMGLAAPREFGGLSMHSPANTRFMGIMRDEYAKVVKQPFKIFMSVGNESDNRRAVRNFKNLLEEKGYDVTFIQNDQGHTWSNWRPIVDDALLTFFATN